MSEYPEANRSVSRSLRVLELSAVDLDTGVRIAKQGFCHASTTRVLPEPVGLETTGSLPDGQERSGRQKHLVNLATFSTAWS